MLLAGDVGGTKTLLGLFELTPGRPAPLDTHAYVTADFEGFSSILMDFLDRVGVRLETIEAVCFGVAGPIRGKRARLTNIGWSLDADDLRARFQVRRLHLLNDLEAIAYAIPILVPAELVLLQAGSAAPDGNAAVIAAGTGLGEAFLHRVASRLVPMPSEGGHADFAARTPREFELARFLIHRYGRASVEHVVSGPGLANICAFTHPRPCNAIPAGADPIGLPAFVSAAALNRRCPQCEEALDLFVAAYGSEAGNLALRGVATGGLYVAGGIAPKILPALEAPRFMDAFRGKPPMESLLAGVPVAVLTNPDAGLLGAAVFASDLVREAPRA